MTSFEINIIFLIFRIEFQFSSQTLVRKYKLRRLVLFQVQIVIPTKRISVHNQNYHIFFCIRLSFINSVAKVPFACLKNFWLKFRKIRFFEHNFEKFSRFSLILSKFCFCFKARAKINTIFSVGGDCAGRFAERKHFSNFLGMLPTFGFRISMVSNGGKQIFIKF